MDNVSVLAAFGAGVVSFLSPCVLPLVPGYISIVSGISLEQLQSEEKNQGLMKVVVINSLFFIIGFSVIFITLGASATALGQLLMSRMTILYRIAGIIIVIFGLHLIGIIKIPFLYQDKRFHNVPKPRGMFGAFILGLAYAGSLGGLTTLIGTFCLTSELLSKSILSSPEASRSCSGLFGGFGSHQNDRMIQF